MDDFAGPSFHSARWDHTVDHRGKRFALIGAGASGFQIAPTIADEVEQLTVFQRTAQWMFPNANYHRRVPDGERWAMRHLPFYGRWFRFLTFYPGRRPHHRALPHRSRLRRRRARRSARRTGRRARCSPSWIAAQLGDDAELEAKVMPDYPATAKRMLQDNGSWLACLRKDNVELVRTGIERIVADGVVTVDGTFRPADVICYATGFRHNDFLWPMHITGRDGRGAARAVGRRADRVPRHHGAELPEPLLPLRAGHEPRARRQPDLPVRVPGQLRDGGAARAAHVGTAAPSSRARRSTTSTPARYQSEISQMVWAHWSVKHSHFKNPDGKIFTLSPWPIPHVLDVDQDLRAEGLRLGLTPASELRCAGRAISSIQVTLAGGSVTPPLPSASPGDSP